MNQSRVHQLLASKQGIPVEKSAETQLFDLRLASNLSLIQRLFLHLYPEAQFPGRLEKLLDLLPHLFRERPSELRLIDLERQYQRKDPWFTDNRWVGMQLYVDRFAGGLKELENRLDYFEDLGVNFLHLMPITPRPEGENDGGYAVNDYTGVDPKYGTKEDLLRLTKSMRKRDMALMLDFVVNHTSDEFHWARKAKQGEEKYQAYYYTYPDRTIPDTFEKSLPEIFPESSPGNFTYCEPMGRWVMTVFNRYQWDLNYSNPEVFLEMLTILAKLVNQGVDVVRFDALAFLWKKAGTNSQNLPEAHMLVSLFKMCLQVFAPGVAILAEAIVAPKDIVRYFGEEERRGNECDLAYNASYMALLWNSIATTKSNLLYKSLEAVPPKPPATSWINYIRCHDDIGLGYDDALIAELGWDPKHHRAFLLDYYTQRLQWSNARGLLFMYNPRNGDGRITGSAASLLGLEAALDSGDTAETELAIRKILSMHGLILAMGGIPMIYAGDELGTLNDYSFRDDPDLVSDSRWVNRPYHPWKKYKAKGYGMQIFNSLKSYIELRKSMTVFADRDNTVFHHFGNDHIFAFERWGSDGKSILVLMNFDRNEQVVDASRLKSLGYVRDMAYHDLITGKDTALKSALLPLSPYQLYWLRKF